MHHINWSDSVWFFDVDDTLINTEEASSIASDAIGSVFAKYIPSPQASGLVREFNKIFNHMVMGYRAGGEEDWEHIPGGKKDFDALLQEIASCQKNVVAEYGVYKKFSREVFIKIAADRLGITYSPETIAEAANAYWVRLTEQTRVYPDARKLIAEIRAHHRPVCLLTSSDARLKLNNTGQFAYIPSYSERLKRERVEMLRSKGLDFDIVSIGDPEDKPHRKFFEKGIRKAEDAVRQKIDPQHAIMCGDSFTGDLQTPKEVLGFGLVVLFQKERKSTDVIDEHQINTGDLSEIISHVNG